MRADRVGDKVKCLFTKSRNNSPYSRDESSSWIYVKNRHCKRSKKLRDIEENHKNQPNETLVKRVMTTITEKEDTSQCIERVDHYNILVRDMKERTNLKKRKRTNSESRGISIFKSFINSDLKAKALGRSTSMNISNTENDGNDNQLICNNIRTRRHTESKDTGGSKDINIIRKLSIRNLPCIYKENNPIKDHDFIFLKLINNENSLSLVDNVSHHNNSDLLLKKSTNNSNKNHIVKTKLKKACSLEVGIYKSSLLTNKNSNSNGYINKNEKDSMEIVNISTKPRQVTRRILEHRVCEVEPPMSLYAIQEKRNTIILQN